MRKQNSEFCIKRYLDKKSKKYPQYLREELIFIQSNKDNFNRNFYPIREDEHLYKVRDH